MKLTVFGASGGVGSRVVEQALKAGHHVRAIHRGDAPAPVAANHEPLLLKEFHDASALRQVIAGSDAVISCLGHRRRSARNPWSRLLSAPDFMEGFAAAVIQAMESPGAPGRLVAVSAAGVGSSAPAMHPFLRLVFMSSSIGVAYRDLARMESRLERSALDWTAVRPVTLTPFRPSGRTRPCERYGLFDHISRADVASYLLRCAEDPAFAPSRAPMIRG